MLTYLITVHRRYRQTHS